MIVAAVQLKSGSSREKNLERAGNLVENAARSGAGLVVLPELFDLCLPPGDMNNQNWLQDNASLQGSKTLQWLSQISGDFRITLCGGTILFRKKNEVFVNRCFIFGPNGREIAHYDKMHLARICTKEGIWKGDKYLVAGKKTTIFPISLPRNPMWCGIGVCFDLRFPEMFRFLCMHKPLELLCIPAAFYTLTGPEHWELLLRARALENRVYVVGANQVGLSEDGNCYCGHSMIVDPFGRIVCTAKTRNHSLVLAEVDRALQKEIRERIPAMPDRRFLSKSG